MIGSSGSWSTRLTTSKCRPANLPTTFWSRSMGFPAVQPARSENCTPASFGGLRIIGIDPLDVLIVINEVPLENWGIRGGQSAAEVDLGFALDV